MFNSHEKALKKSPNEGNISGFWIWDGTSCWYLDFSYQKRLSRGNGIFFSFNPSKKLRNGRLKAAKEEENRQISPDRIILRNLFWRIWTLWGMMAKNTDVPRKNMIYFTLLLLCEGDGEAYRRSKKFQYTRGTEVSRRRAAIQKRYRHSSHDRLSISLRARYRNHDQVPLFRHPFSPYVYSNILEW